MYLHVYMFTYIHKKIYIYIYIYIHHLVHSLEAQPVGQLHSDGLAVVDEVAHRLK